jgi:hypothetical protein
LTLRNVQKALADLESGEAIVRTVTRQVGQQNWRAIYPARGVVRVAGVTSTMDVGGHVHEVDVQNLRRIPRRPKTQLAYARLAALARERGEATAPAPEPVPAAAELGCPSNGARCGAGAPPTGKRWRH